MRTTYSVAYRRKREGRTDYHKRLKLLASKKPRFAVRKSLDNIMIQAIEYQSEGDRVLVSAHTRELAKYGWKAHTNNTPAAYLVGMLFGKKVLAAGIQEGIADIGMQASVKGCVLFAAVKGITDAGVKVSLAQDMVPDAQRIKGAHIAHWAKQLKEKDLQKYERTFSTYLKNTIKPEELPNHVEEVRQKIAGGAA